MGAIGWGIGHAIGSALGAASSAIKNSNKNKGSSSSSPSSSASSSSSRPPSSSSGSSSKPSSGGSSSGSGGSFWSDGTDYMALMQDAAQRGDLASAAYYETLRNKKIDAGYGGSYEKTNYYQNYNNQNAGQDTIYGDSPYAPSYDDSAVQAELERAKAEAEAARNATIESGVTSLQQQIPGINQNYDEAARQAYINYMMAQKQLPTQLSAVGISGQGAAESTLAQQQNAYQNTLSGTELARQNALQANQDAQQNVKLSADLKYADNATNIALQQAQAAQQYLAQQQAALDSQKNYLLNYGSMVGNVGGTPTLAWQQLQSDNGYKDKQLAQNQQGLDSDRNTALKNLYIALWQGMGTKGATQEIAQILGIPVGSVYGQGTYNTNFY